jgi:hypothetical protein
LAPRHYLQSVQTAESGRYLFYGERFCPVMRR